MTNPNFAFLFLHNPFQVFDWSQASTIQGPTEEERQARSEAMQARIAEAEEERKQAIERAEAARAEAAKNPRPLYVPDDTPVTIKCDSSRDCYKQERYASTCIDGKCFDPCDTLKCNRGFDCMRKDALTAECI